MKTETVPNEIERQERLKIKTTSVNNGRTLSGLKAVAKGNQIGGRKKYFKKQYLKFF